MVAARDVAAVGGLVGEGRVVAEPDPVCRGELAGALGLVEEEGGLEVVGVVVAWRELRGGGELRWRERESFGLVFVRSNELGPR